MNSTLGVAFLGVIALASLVQSAILVWLAVSALRLARRVGEIERQLDRELRPVLADVSRIGRSVAELSELATLQGRRVDAFLASSLEKLDDTTSQLRQLALLPLAPLGGLAALARAFQTGFRVYRRLGGLERQGRGGPRQYPTDEHLFI